MILSDRSLRERLAAGSIGIDPLDETAVQPASVDLRLASAFRVFTRHRHTHVDLAREQTDLTELVEVADGGRFALHPGSSCSGAHWSGCACPMTSWAASRARAAWGASA